MTRFKSFLALAACGAFLSVFSLSSAAHAQSVPCYMEQGGSKLVIGSGCTLDIDTGAAIEMGGQYDQSFDLPAAGPRFLSDLRRGDDDQQ